MAVARVEAVLGVKSSEVILSNGSRFDVLWEDGRHAWIQIKDGVSLVARAVGYGGAWGWRVNAAAIVAYTPPEELE